MRVLIITNLSKGNSATLPERNLFIGLHLKGVDVTVLAESPSSESLDLESAGIRLLYQPITRKIDIPAIRKIRSLLRKEKYDILHFTYSKAISNGLIASYGIKVRTIGYLGSLSVHWHDPFSYFSFLNPGLDRLICVSDGVNEHVLKQLPARMKNRTIRIYKGSNPEWLNNVVPARRCDLGIPENAFVVCCVANIRKSKGVKWLIESANFLPANLPLWFLLVGDKTDSNVVRKRIRKTKYPDNFITTGYSAEPNAFTSICDLYIQPSVSEGLPKSVIEAMCLKKPVIVTERGGAKELVIEGINGYIIPVRSAKAIAETILKCYENRDNLSAMGEKGMERIKNYFSHQMTIDSTFNLYRELMERKSDRLF